MKRFIQTVVVILSFIFMTSNEMLHAESSQSFSEWKNEKPSFAKSEESFKKALEILKKKYIDQNITESDLYRAATEGMLHVLNKSHLGSSQEEKKEYENRVANELLAPREAEDMQIQLTHQLVGIGVTLDFDETTKNSKVLFVLPDSPALKAGLLKYDIILSANGKRFQNLRSLVNEIRGMAGTTVALKVLREDKILDFKVERGAVVIPLYRSYLLDDKTGYLEISGFSKNAHQEIQKKLSFFQDKKIDKMILDLQSNAGGLSDEMQKVSELFAQEGEVLFKTKDRYGQLKEIRARKGNKPYSFAKIIVLVGPSTGSSAEVLAAFLRDSRKAILIGDRTQGKWTAEAIEALPNGYSLKYAVLQLFSSKEKSFQDVGLLPDYEVKILNKTEEKSIQMIDDIKERMQKDPVLKQAIDFKIE